jgi:hypothetical protein
LHSQAWIRFHPWFIIAAEHTTGKDKIQGDTVQIAILGSKGRAVTGVLKEVIVQATGLMMADIESAIYLHRLKTASWLPPDPFDNLIGDKYAAAYT